jgi:methylmalonyl-CoA/ethylmalonyl-CoA epimerase
MSIPDHSALSRIGQIAINAHDVDRATAFYRDVLGLPHLFRAGQLSFFDCGSARLMLTKPEKPEFDHPSSILYFQVTDIQAAFQRLKSGGAKFEDEPRVITACPSTIYG